MIKPPPKPQEIKEKPIVVKKEGKAFFVKAINLVGCESFPPEDFKPLVDKYVGREVVFGELDALAKEIGREYLKRGIIAVVFVPPQEVKEGVVTLNVIEARMGELQIQKFKYFKNSRLGYYWHTKPGEILHYDKISRDLQIMNKNPDRESKVALKAGQKPGTTDAILTTESQFPIHFSFSFDKEGQTSTGKSRKTFGVRDNNLLNMDDSFLSGYSTGRNFTGVYGYHSIPLTPTGTTLLYGYSYGESKPVKDFSDFGIDSKAEDRTFAFHQDLFRKDQYWGEAYAGFDAKDKLVKTNTGILNRDKLRILRLGGSALSRRQDSSTTFSTEYSQGFNGFCASSQDDELVARGARSVFTKFTGGMRNRSLLPLDIQENFNVRGQFTFAKLTPEEEFSLGGMDTVRGYPPDDYYADSAFLFNYELLLPSIFIPKDWRLPYAPKTAREMTTSVVFLDYGYGQRRGDQEKGHNDLGIGGGLRFDIYNQAILRLEWAYPLGDNPITEGRASRFHISLDIQEKLPEEMDRIKKVMEEERIQHVARKLVEDEMARPDSPLRQKMLTDLYLARLYYDEGKLKESEALYKGIDELSKSLYQQAEGYVRACAAIEKKLKEENKTALAAYNEGRIDDARRIWGKIIEDAKFKPLTLRY